MTVAAGSNAFKILNLASPSWFRCYDGEEIPGRGLQAAAEAMVIEQRL